MTSPSRAALRRPEMVRHIGLGERSPCCTAPNIHLTEGLEMSFRLQDADALERVLAEQLCRKFRDMQNSPGRIRIAGKGRFSVLVIDDGSRTCQMRVLIFNGETVRRAMVVQVNLTRLPIVGSTRQICLTSSYEELRTTFTDTTVDVLDEHSFAEFMACYDQLDEELQELLDGAELSIEQGTDLHAL